MTDFDMLNIFKVIFFNVNEQILIFIGNIIYIY